MTIIEIKTADRKESRATKTGKTIKIVRKSESRNPLKSTKRSVIDNGTIALGVHIVDATTNILSNFESANLTCV